MNPYDIEGSGPTLVVITHGWNSHRGKDTYVDFARIVVEEGHTALRFDFSGHGEADGEASFAQGRADLREVVGTFRTYEHTILIGNSFGAMVGLFEHQLFNELVLVAPGFPHERLGFPDVPKDTPVTIIAGSDDATVPYEDQVGLHKHIPHSQLITLEGCGHRFREADCYERRLDTIRALVHSTSYSK
ncbi:MAG: alpha/beta hydrolase [Candidatus Woesearchaeota archaeon]